MNELATKQDIPQPTGFAGMMERLAANPDIPTDKLRELLEMQVSILDREAKQEFAEAMMRVQAQTPTIRRDKWNDQTKSRYARLETISAALKPIYTKEGFSLTFSQGKSDIDGMIRIDAIVRHKAGHSESHWIDLPRDDAGIKGNVNKTPTHATGSTYSYGRRYLTCMIFDVATGDDVDGNQPAATITEEQADELTTLAAEVGADMMAFLKVLKVESLSDLPAAKFDGARKRLEAKRG